MHTTCQGNGYDFIPPGAVGGRYGSGCFHLLSIPSASRNNACLISQPLTPFYTLILSSSVFRIGLILVLVLVLERLCWLRRAIWCTVLDPSRCGGERTSRGRALELAGRAYCQHLLVIVSCFSRCCAWLTEQLPCLSWFRLIPLKGMGRYGEEGSFRAHYDMSAHINWLLPLVNSEVAQLHYAWLRWYEVGDVEAPLRSPDWWTRPRLSSGHHYDESCNLCKLDINTSDPHLIPLFSPIPLLPVVKGVFYAKCRAFDVFVKLRIRNPLCGAVLRTAPRH